MWELQQRPTNFSQPLEAHPRRKALAQAPSYKSRPSPARKTSRLLVRNILKSIRPWRVVLAGSSFHTNWKDRWSLLWQQRDSLRLCSLEDLKFETVDLTWSFLSDRRRRVHEGVTLSVEVATRRGLPRRSPYYLAGEGFAEVTKKHVESPLERRVAHLSRVQIRKIAISAVMPEVSSPTTNMPRRTLPVHASHCSCLLSPRNTSCKQTQGC